MAVFREATISWDGRSWRFTPSNRLLRRIEGEGGLSLTAMIAGAQRGELRISQLAFLLASCLQEAGARVTEDDMLAALMGANAEAAMALSSEVFAAIFPEVDAKKAAGAPPVPAAPGKVRPR